MTPAYSAPQIVETWPLRRDQVAQLRRDGVQAVAVAVANELRGVALLEALLVGRDDAYLDEHRGCVKRPLTRRVIYEHLLGKRRIGAYGLLPRGNHALAKFLAVDIDGKHLAGGRPEALRRANEVAKVLEDLDLPAYIEQSRSGLGFHVWVFYGPNEVPLEATQQLGRLVVRLTGLPTETEVFPKGGAKDPYGATPFIPLHGFLSARPSVTLFVAPDGFPREDQFEWLADVQCVTGGQVAAAIGEAEIRLAQLPSSGNERNRLQQRRVDTSRILQGVPEGQREQSLFRLACSLRRADVPQQVAEEIVTIAAVTCTPAFPTTTAVSKVTRAYTRYPAGESDAEGWTPPTPFHTSNLPEFPVDALTP